MFATVRKAWRGMFGPNLYAFGHIESKRRNDGLDTSATDVHRILVCRPNRRLGNAVLLTPLIVELQRLFPDATVDIAICGGIGVRVFGAFRNVRNIIELPHHMAKHPLRAFITSLGLRRHRYDLAIDPCETSRSGRVMLFLAGAKHSLSIADAVRSRKSSVVELQRQPPPHFAKLPIFELRRSIRSHEALGHASYPAMTLNLSDAEKNAGRSRLAKTLAHTQIGADPITLGIFAGATGEKRYDAEWWKRVVDAIRDMRSDIAIVELASESGHASLGPDIPSYTSPCVREVASFISALTCFVCADSGVMHLASASGAPTIGLFKVTPPEKYEPYGRDGSCSIDTNNTTPEDVARIVVEKIERLRPMGLADATHPPREFAHAVGGMH